MKQQGWEFWVTVIGLVVSTSLAYATLTTKVEFLVDAKLSDRLSTLEGKMDLMLERMSK